MIEARKALLDVLEGLNEHRESMVLIGAQALYLHTQSFRSPVVPATKDADLALNVLNVSESPSIEIIMRDLGFELGDDGNPGRWFSKTKVPVDIMVPKRIAGSKSRAASTPNHGKRLARTTEGIEGCLVDFSIQSIGALDPRDSRIFDIAVAGPASILIAKSFKIFERINSKRPLQNKDSYDVYRLLAVVETEVLMEGLNKLLADPFSQEVTEQGLGYIHSLFAAGDDAEGSRSAGRAEENIGDPKLVSQAVAILAKNLLKSLGKSGYPLE